MIARIQPGPVIVVRCRPCLQESSTVPAQRTTDLGALPFPLLLKVAHRLLSSAVDAEASAAKQPDGVLNAIQMSALTRQAQ